jgi:hypothetical protein
MKLPIKLLFIVLLILFSFNLSAQKGKKKTIDIRAEFGVNHSFFHEYYPQSAYSYSYMYNPPTSLDITYYPSFQAGIDANWVINKHVIVSTGLLYRSRRSKRVYDKVQIKNYFDTSGVSRGYSSINYNGMVQIPVSIAYYVNRWYFHVGLSIPLFSHSFYVGESFTGKYSGSFSSFIWNKSFYFHIDTFAKLEFELNTNRKINLFATVTHTSFSSNLEKTLYAVGVNFSLTTLMKK